MRASTRTSSACRKVRRMRVLVALALAVLVARPASAGEPEPYVRTCSSSAYGDLGAGWRERAVVAGHLAFVGLKDGYRGVTPAPAGRARPPKVLVVVDPNAAPTVTIAAGSRGYAALGYNKIPGGNPVPLAAGTMSVRFQ